MNRRLAIDILLVALLVALVGFAARRHLTPPPPSSPAEPTLALDDAGPPDAGPDAAHVPIDPPAEDASPPLEVQEDAGAPLAEDDASVPPAAPEPDAAAAATLPSTPSEPMGRPLRVAALSWSVLVPVVAMPESQPTEPRVLDSWGPLATALALGGDDPEGSDVALVTLSDWARLHAEVATLDLEAFGIAAWTSSGPTLGAAIPPTTPVLDVPRATPLDENLVLLARLGLALGAPLRVASTPSRALQLGSGGSPWVGADLASRAVPWVMLARRPVLEQRRALIQGWLRAWLEASAVVAGDPPAAARRVATEHAVELLPLLQRMGSIRGATIPDNRCGLSDLGGMEGSHCPWSLAELFERTWRDARTVGTLASAAPAVPPIATGIVGTLPARPMLVACTPGATVVVTLPVDTRSDVARRLASVALAFPDSQIEVAVPASRRTAIDAELDRIPATYGIARSCFVTTSSSRALVRIRRP